MASVSVLGKFGFDLARRVGKIFTPHSNGGLICIFFPNYHLILPLD